jgi:branched-chain amino acid aminotransferase
MTVMVNVNGVIHDQEHAVVSALDHGFLYGEGVYETMRTYNSEPFLFDRHMRRMRNSAGMLALPVPLTDAQLYARCRETMEAAGLGTREAYLRILITRGAGELSYDLAACAEPTTVVIAKPQIDPKPEVYARGVTVSLVSTVRNHPGSVSPLIKSNNLLNNSLAMQEALRRGTYEGLMRNYRGELAECTQSNIFVVKDGVVSTPPLDAGLLPGITREFLFEVGEGLGVPVRESVLHDAELFAADEAFLTSTTRELVPIVRVDDRTIGGGAPGPITLALLASFRQKAHGLARGTRVVS